jgi:hypothetical protein
MRQREDQDIPDYPLFTHEEIDRIAKRLTGVPFGQPKKFKGAATRSRSPCTRRPCRRAPRPSRSATSTGRSSSPATSSSRTSARSRAPSSPRATSTRWSPRRPAADRAPPGEDPRRGDGAPGRIDQRHDPAGRLLPDPGLRARPHAGDPLHRPRRPEVPAAGRLPDLRIGPRHGPRRLLRRDQPQDQAHPVQPRDREGPEGPPAAAEAQAGRGPGRTPSTSSAPGCWSSARRATPWPRAPRPRAATRSASSATATRTRPGGASSPRSPATPSSSRRRT